MNRAPFLEPRQSIANKKSTRRASHWLLRLSPILLVLALAFVSIGYRDATAAPVERHLNLRIATYAAHQPRLRLVLFSDVHVHGPDMPPSRLQKIIDDINAQRPDVVVAAGDFLGNNLFGRRYSIDASVAPLARLKPRLGVYAVLGNNDYAADPGKVAIALDKVHVRVLENRAVRVGPLVLGGADYRLDWPRSRALVAVDQTLARMKGLAGLKVLVAHSPDVFPTAEPIASLVLAGHTHCGQIALPLFGPVLTGSHFGREFACGAYRRGNSVLVVTGGLGTSHVPLRLAAPPDFWVIDIAGR